MNIPEHFHYYHRRMVEFADTDLAGLMHFSNFFRFVESAEHAFFRSLGFRVHTSEGSDHQGWPRVEVSCKYLRPARFEQTLEICLHLEEIRTSSLRYTFWIFADGEKRQSPLATGTCAIVHVALDTATREIRKAPIPTALRHQLDRAVTSPRTQS
jgi:acyl-CoA thioester hydrolase